MKSGFLEKLVARLDRVEHGEVQQIVTRLIREKGFLEKVFEALQEGVILLDPNGVIDFVNQAACRFFGLDADKATGEHLSSQVRGLDWRSLGKPGRALSRDLEVFYPENRFLNFYLSPIDEGENSGETLGYVMLVRDLTRTRAEAEANLESERLNALTLLAAGVAHEIGNPLNSLDIHLQLLGRKLRKLPPGDREPLEEHLTTARGEIQRLDSILKQFLHAVRPTAPRRERRDLHALLRDSLRLLEHELVSRKIAVELDLAELFPLMSVDPGQFQQVFYNLVRNAYQALPSEHGRITIRTRFNDYETVITIEDNGTGMTEEVRAKIFEPFFTTKDIGKGTGLGLATVYGIVKQSGGFLFVDSEIGKGSTFRIFLPAYVASEEEAAAPVEKPKGENKPADLAGKGRILLVEDEAAVRSIAAKTLAKRGYDVVEAGDGEEAYEILTDDEDGFDLLVSDVVMPGLDGPGLLAKAEELLADTRVIFISGYAEEQFSDTLSRDKDISFLPKPFTLTQLAERVKSVLTGDVQDAA